jgi:hypothetical protein
VQAQRIWVELAVDTWATALLKFPGDILAELSTAVGLSADNGVQIFGSKGSISVADPWTPSRWNREPLEIKLRIHGEGESTVLVPAEKDLYAYEADMVGEHIAQRQAPAMSWDDSLGNIRVLDRWRGQIGLTYEMEKPKNALRTITGRALEVKPNNMKYGRIEGVEKPVSRLLIGADTTHTMPTPRFCSTRSSSLAAMPSTPRTRMGTKARANAIWARGFAIVASVSKSWCWKRRQYPTKGAGYARK